ncbi:nucleotidyltransferase family protein [Clostridium beijerinckii]|uniref:nucleotidyltransferase family protein n=1 Tax=Clostridium beijerinckii TaxID=1520 RepID=UPI001494C01C|nr:nucleotidyltransferase family protein [Clostridium beijerinckii]NOW03533.1 CTP:molybdopterin cytidylyltransferase MocA [Clostridium beijerinckii]NRT71088.1 CTP:molybdopterin cytidylyltransferase MocA [Clostridium beijerinckii]NYC03325.1 CTP:molybdopterin cytidylyltransferase MocA [Clostridium beijerinckii]
MKTNGIIVAAGLSSRMKAFKPLLKLKEKTIIEYSIDSMLNAGVNQIVVVLGFNAEEVENLLRNKYDCSQLTFIYNEKYAETDMLASVKLGVLALDNCDAFYLLPGDMPAIKTMTFLMVKDSISRTGAMVAFPTINGQRKHPPLISWKCIDFIINFHGDGGLRELWNQLEDQIVTVHVEDFGCTIDADTKEDYNRLVHYMDEKN